MQNSKLRLYRLRLQGTIGYKELIFHYNTVIV